MEDTHCKPSSEQPMHTLILHEMPETNAMIHITKQAGTPAAFTGCG